MSEKMRCVCWLCTDVQSREYRALARKVVDTLLDTITVASSHSASVLEESRFRSGVRDREVFEE